MLLALASAGCMDCTIEAHVDDFFDDHDAIDCKFGHMISGLGERSVVGAEQVRDCILDAVDHHRAFVGGSVLGGIDSSSTYAYLGTSRGEIHLLREEWFQTRTLRSSPCSSLVVTGSDGHDIGLGCAGENFEPLCDE